MKPAAILTAVGLLSALGACGGSTRSADLPIDPLLTIPCREATLLPDRGLSQAEVEIAWRADRVALRDCRERHGLLVDWLED